MKTTPGYSLLLMALTALPALCRAEAGVTPVRADSAWRWDDRRPIAQLFLSQDANRSTSNPDGYLNKDVDVNTDEGRAAFLANLLAYADRCITIITGVGGQGMIVWDLEGYQQPGMVYVGDPRVLPEYAPAMDRVADAFFQKFRDAGLRTGLTIRPNVVRRNPPEAVPKWGVWGYHFQRETKDLYRQADYQKRAAEIPADANLERLLALSGDPSAAVRFNAVRALAAKRDTAAVPRLQAMLQGEGEDWLVRKEVIVALGTIQGAAAIPMLVAEVERANYGEHLAALEQLRQHGEVALPAALALAKGAKPQTRADAASLLGTIATKPAVEALATLMSDGDEQVRRQATAWFTKIPGAMDMIAPKLGDPAAPEDALNGSASHPSSKRHDSRPRFAWAPVCLGPRVGRP